MFPIIMAVVVIAIIGIGFSSIFEAEPIIIRGSTKLPPPLTEKSKKADVTKVANDIQKQSSHSIPSSTGLLPGEKVDRLPDFRTTKMSSYPESINVSVSEFENYYDIRDHAQPMAGIEHDFHADFMDYEHDEYLMDHDS